MSHLPALPTALRASILVAISLLLGACEKGPSPDAWGGSVETIETVNGMSVKLEKGETLLEGMREGSAVPAGSTITTEPGVAIQLALDDGTTIIADGSTRLTLEETQARGATFHEGRIFVALGDGGGSITMFGHDLNGTGGARFAIEGTKERGSISVLSGQIVTTKATLGSRTAALVSKDEVERFTAWDLDERTAWLNRDDGLAGYGDLEGGGDRVKLTDHRVRATIVDAFAETEVVESFQNTGEAADSLLYSFELPPGAVLIDLAIRQDGEWIDGIVDSTSEAKRAFKKAEKEGRQAVIMSVTDGVASLETGTIDAGENLAFRVKFIQQLEATYGGHRYRYEMPWDRDADLRASRFSIDARVLDAPAGKVATYGYEMTSQQDAEAFTASFEAGDFVPAGDFVVDVLSRKKGSVLREKRDDEEFVGVTVRPEFDAPEQKKPVDLLVAIDTSGSRELLSAFDGELVSQVLQRVSNTTRVLVADCDIVCRPAFDDREFVSAEELVEPTTRFDPNYGGPTNVGALGEFAREVFEDRPDDRARMVVYLTDGGATTGDLVPGPGLASALEAARARLHVVGLEDDEVWIDSLADFANGTASEYVADDIEKTAEIIAAHVADGILTDVKIDLPEGVTSVYPEEVWTLREGEAFTFVGKAKKGARVDSIVLRGQIADEPFEEVIGLDLEGTFRPLVSSVWAAARIDDLESRGADIGARQTSEEYGVPSALTTFVATQRPAARPRSTVDIVRGSEVIQEKRKITQKRRKPSAHADGANETASGARAKRKPADSGLRIVAGDPRPTPRYRRKRFQSTRFRPAYELETGRVSVFPAEVDEEPYVDKLRAYRDHLGECLHGYGERELATGSDLTIQFEIEPNGVVKSVQTMVDELDHDRVEHCLTTAIRTWTFPDGEFSKTVRMTQPFTIREVSRGSGINKPKIYHRSLEERTIAFDGAHPIEHGVHDDAGLFLTALHGTARPTGVANNEERFAHGLASNADTNSIDSDYLARAFFGRDADAALGRMIEELGPSADLLLTAAEHEERPRVACAHLRAAAFLLDAEAPDCEDPGALKRLADRARPIGDESLEIELLGSSGEQIALVDLNRRRYWSFESRGQVDCKTIRTADEPVDDGTTRAPDDDAERFAEGRRCTFSGLKPGLYGLQVIWPTAPIKLRITGEGFEHRGEIDPMEDLPYVATIAVGDVIVEAPTVRLPVASDFNRSSNRYLESLKPIVAWCHLANGAPLPAAMEASLAIDGEGKVSIEEAGAPSAVRECVSTAFQKVDLPGAPKEGTTHEYEFRFRK